MAPSGAQHPNRDNANPNPIAQTGPVGVGWSFGARGALPLATKRLSLDGAPNRSGPNAPLTEAFVFCGWRCLPVDWEISPDHDLSNPFRQQSLHTQLAEADCIFAAFDCSTKSRAREIPRVFQDGRKAPGPLRSTDYPSGLPSLTAAQQRRVDTDNSACSFVLDEISAGGRGGISVRETPCGRCTGIILRR